MARTKGKGRSSSSFANNWSKAAADRGEGFGEAVPVEPGNYEMQLCKASIDDYDSGRKIMLKFVVLEPEDSAGAICTYWEGIESDERLVWLQRLMIALGIDLDSVTIESEDDLLAAFVDVIDEGCAVKVRVAEKDGYTNMRVLRAIDRDDMLDPAEVLSGTSQTKDSDSDGEAEAEDEAEAEAEAVSKSDLSVGCWVQCTIKGKEIDAEVTSLPPRGSKVQVRPDGGKASLIDVSDISAVYEDEDEDGEPEAASDGDKPEDGPEEEAAEASDELEIETGDWVTYKDGRKKIEAEIVKVIGNKAKIKLESGKVIVKPLDELELMLEG